MKKIKSILANNKYLKFISNRYALGIIIFLLWILFLDNYSYLEHRVLNKEIEELENNIQYYKKEIYNDSIKIKKLKNLNEIEKYAREKYYMKRENEDVYIIEFENKASEKE